MRGLERRDVFLAPRAVALSPDLDAFDAKRWVVMPDSNLHRELHHRAQRIEEIACSSRRGGLGANHTLDVHALERCDALIAVLSTEAFEDVAPGAPRLVGELAKGNRSKICSGEGRDSARLAAACADLDPLRDAQRLRIGFHELGRPRQARQWHLLEPGTAEITSDFAVPIKKLMNVVQPDACHR